MDPPAGSGGDPGGLWALLLPEDWLHARLFTPWGYEINPRRRPRTAEEWSS